MLIIRHILLLMRWSLSLKLGKKSLKLRVSSVLLSGINNGSRVRIDFSKCNQFGDRLGDAVRRNAKHLQQFHWGT